MTLGTCTFSLPASLVSTSSVASSAPVAGSKIATRRVGSPVYVESAANARPLEMLGQAG